MHHAPQHQSARARMGFVLIAVSAMSLALTGPAAGQGEDPDWEQLDILPRTTYLADIWAFGSPDTTARAFAVGHDTVANAGVIYFYNGASWTPMDAPGAAGRYLTSVCVAGPSAAFAVGDGLILAFNGTSWRQMSVYGRPDLRAVWAGDANLAFAVGYRGLIMRYTGPKADPFAEWEEMNSSVNNTLYGVWGTGPNNVWAVGTNDLILHFDGLQWTEYEEEGLSFPDERDFNDIHGAAANSIIAVGDGGLIRRFNGTTWEGVNANTTENLRGVYMSDVDHAFAVGYNGGVYAAAGAQWVPRPAEANAGLNAVSGAGDTLFAVGFSGDILLGNFAFSAADPSAWTLMPLTSIDDYHGIWGSGPDHIVVVGDGGRIVRWDGSAWATMVSNTSRPFSAVWGDSPSSVFAAVYDCALPSGDCYTLGEVDRYDGTTWAYLSGSVGRPCTALWGSGPNDVFVVGAFGRISRFNGTSWSEMDSGTDTHLYGIWGAASGNVFAVGNSGEIRHYNGANWASMNSGTTNTLSGIWGSGPSDVFVVGGGETILHYDGSNWTTMPPPPPPSGGGWVGFPLNHVWGSGPTDVFAVGDFGTVLHYNGTEWARMNSGTAKHLSAVWGSGPTNVLAVGKEGLILHYPRPATPSSAACCAGGAGNAFPIAAAALLAPLIPGCCRRKSREAGRP